MKNKLLIWMLLLLPITFASCKKSKPYYDVTVIIEAKRVGGVEVKYWLNKEGRTYIAYSGNTIKIEKIQVFEGKKLKVKAECQGVELSIKIKSDNIYYEKIGTGSIESEVRF